MSAGRARKKPVEIEFRRLTRDNHAVIARWCFGRHKGLALAPEDQIVQIDTLEGEMTASVGDVIIKGVNGEFYPCKPDIFAKTYDIIEEG